MTIASIKTQSRCGSALRAGGFYARRQLRLAFGVVVVSAVTIVGAAVVVGQHPISAKRDVVAAMPLVTIHADTDPVGAKAI